MTHKWLDNFYLLLSHSLLAGSSVHLPVTLPEYLETMVPFIIYYRKSDYWPFLKILSLTSQEQILIIFPQQQHNQSEYLVDLIEKTAFCQKYTGMKPIS